MPEVWTKDLPPVERRGHRGKYDWPDIVKRLKRRPGKWTVVDEEAALGITSASRRQKMTALRDPEWTFEYATRDNDTITGKCTLWMRATKREET